MRESLLILETQLRHKTEQEHDEVISRGDGSEESPLVMQPSSDHHRKNPPRPEDKEFRIKQEVVHVEPKSSQKKKDIKKKDQTSVFDEDDEVAIQIVHEMMQLLQYSRKTRNEAERLLQYKKVAIAHNREVHPDLERQLHRIMSHDKLTVSFNRFIAHKMNGDYPITSETLTIEMQLRHNIKALKTMASVSEELNPRNLPTISLMDSFQSAE